MPEVAARLAAALEGRYTLDREVGRGGMATVYLAEDLKHNRKVALKVLKPELAAIVGADRFLMIRSIAGSDDSQLIVVRNWFEKVNERLGG